MLATETGQRTSVSDIRSEARSFLHRFDDDTREYERIEISFPMMPGNKAVSSFIMTSLLGKLSNVPITPGFLLSLEDTTHLEETSPSLSDTTSMSPGEFTMIQQIGSKIAVRGFRNSRRSVCAKE